MLSFKIISEYCASDCTKVGSLTDLLPKSCPLLRRVLTSPELWQTNFMWLSALCRLKTTIRSFSPMNPSFICSMKMLLALLAVFLILMLRTWQGWLTLCLKHGVCMTGSEVSLSLETSSSTVEWKWCKSKLPSRPVFLCWTWWVYEHRALAEFLYYTVAFFGVFKRVSCSMYMILSSPYYR